MTRLWTAGLEANDNTLEGIDTSVPAVFSTAVVRSGTYAAICDSGAGNTAKSFRVLTSQFSLALNRFYYLRAYLYFTALPSSTVGVLVWGTNFYEVHLTSAGKLRLIWAGTPAQIGSDSVATIATGTWYRVELAFKLGTGALDAAELRLDGVSVASESGTNRSDTLPTTLNAGWLSAPGASKICYVDDVALNNDQGSVQNSWPGSEKIVLLTPTSDFSRAVWTGGAGGTTNLYDAVNNTPPIGTATETNLTQIEHAGSSPGDYYVARTPTLATNGLTDSGHVGIVNLSTTPQTAVNVGDVAAGGALGNTSIAVSFVARAAGTAITQARIWAYKVGAPTDNLEVAIQADSSGIPSGTDLASASVGGGSLTTTITLTTLSLSATLTAGNTYWFVIRRSGAASAVNYFLVGGVATAQFTGNGFTAKAIAVGDWSGASNLPAFYLSTAASQDTIKSIQVITVSGEDSATGTKVYGHGCGMPIINDTTSYNVGADAGALGTYPSLWTVARSPIISPETDYYDAQAQPLPYVQRTASESRVASVCFIGVLVGYEPYVAPPGGGGGLNTRRNLLGVGI